MANQIEKKSKKMDKDYAENCAVLEEAMERDERQARRHIKSLQNSLKEKMKNGTYPEQASLIVSMHVSNQ